MIFKIIMVIMIAFSWLLIYLWNQDHKEELATNRKYVRFCIKKRIQAQQHTRKLLIKNGNLKTTVNSFIRGIK